MKNKLTIALLLAAVYLFWLLFSAPARLLTLALPDGARLGETTGTLWQGEARQASWRGFDIAHLRWEFGFSSWLPGWHIAFNDPSGLRGGLAAQSERRCGARGATRGAGPDARSAVSIRHTAGGSRSGCADAARGPL